MNKFKRKFAEFQGGRVTGLTGFGVTRGVHVELGPQPVKIIRGTLETATEEDEDQFEVEFYNFGGRAIVDGCDLHPHPDSPATNVELLTHIMENGTTAMTQAFVVEAVRKLADATVANADEVKAKMAGTMISGDAWVGAAREVQEGLKDR